MPSDLHHSVWLAYRRSVDSGGNTGAVAGFQAAVDTILCSFPGVDAPSACKEAARMVMMPPPGIGGRRRPRRPTAAILPFPSLATVMRRDAVAQRRR